MDENPLPVSTANSDFSNQSPALGDWRLACAMWCTGIGDKTLDSPLPATQATTYHAKDIHLTFSTPSAAALHLNSSWKSAKRSLNLREKLLAKFHPNAGQPLQMSFEGDGNGPLFDFFEEMIISLSGSCGAVEAFCNRCIIDRATGPLTVKGRKGKETKTPEDVVRYSTLEDKIKRIVPDLMGVSSPAGKEIYDHFMLIKRLRDSVTHFKRHDEAQKAEKVHRPNALTTLFFTDQFTIPEAAMSIIRHLAPGEQTPRWLMNPEWVRPK